MFPASTSLQNRITIYRYSTRNIIIHKKGLYERRTRILYAFATPAYLMRLFTAHTGANQSKRALDRFVRGAAAAAAKSPRGGAQEGGGV